jgi:hypothetical protein
MSFDFDSDEYTAPKTETLPIAQVFSPYLSKKTRALQPYGFEITIDNAEAVDFQPDDAFQLINYTFESGDTNKIYLTTTPRMVIVHRSKVMAEIKKGYPDEGKVIMPSGEWDKNKYKAIQRHIIFFVDKNKKLLHTTPLIFTPKSAAWGSFSNHYSSRERGRLTGGFCSELQEAYTQNKGQKGRRMSDLFFTHGIFSATLKDEERGEGTNTAFVCATVDHAVPTLATWQDFLIETSSNESSIILGVFEEYKDYFNQLASTPNTEFDEVGSISEPEIRYSEDGSVSCSFLFTYYRNQETFYTHCRAEDNLAEQVASADSITDYCLKGIKEGSIVLVKSLETAVF